MIDAATLRAEVGAVLLACGMTRNRRRWVLTTVDTTWTVSIAKLPGRERYRLELDLTLSALPVERGPAGVVAPVGLVQENFDVLAGIDVHELNRATNLEQPDRGVLDLLYPPSPAMPDEERLERITEAARALHTYAAAHASVEAVARAYGAGDFRAAFVSVGARRLFENLGQVEP